MVATFHDENDIYIGSVGSVTVEVAKVIPTAAITFSPSPSNTGQVVAITATLSSPGATGLMTFYDGGTFIGYGSLNGGTATLSKIFRRVAAIPSRLHTRE